MEMVSAVKMRKSQSVALAARPYSQTALAILQRLAHLYEQDYETQDILRDNLFFRKKESGAVPLILIAPERGLVGGLNSTLFAYVKKRVEHLQQNNTPIFGVSVGAKARPIFSKLNIEVQHEFSNNKDWVSPEDIRPITEMITERYKTEDIQSVIAFYTEFFSTLKQSPSQRTLLPIQIQSIEDIIESIAPTEGKWSQEETNTDATTDPDYIFEPDIKTMVDEIVPFLLEITTYHIFLEAQASEHSARMVAMRNASQNAVRILDELTLSYNKARQRAITQEISEVSSGAEALSF